MSAAEEITGDTKQPPALAGSNKGLLSQPGVREAIRSATGLSDDHVDRVAEALAGIGVALILPNGSDKAARYANAIMLVRDHGYSVTRAAREIGISATHLTRKLNILEANGDLRAAADAGDRRILEMSQAMSTLSGEQLLERIEREGNQLKTGELAKIYTSSTNQVAAKQRWSQNGWSAPSETGVSALALLLEKHDVAITERDPSSAVVDVTPNDSEP